MEIEFWLNRWEKDEIGFHENQTNPLLMKYFSRLGLGANPRVFLPLCGKTLDIRWMLAQGCSVVGVELSDRAVKELFAELEVEPSVAKCGKLKCYRAKGLEIYLGDIFELTAEILGGVDAVYDRAALIALPDEMRKRYTPHLLNITKAAPQLLLCLEYDQGLIGGPPFSVSSDEVHWHYRDYCELELLERMSIEGGLKGKHAAHECVWLLESK